MKFRWMELLATREWSIATNPWCMINGFITTRLKVAYVYIQKWLEVVPSALMPGPSKFCSAPTMLYIMVLNLNVFPSDS